MDFNPRSREGSDVICWRILRQNWHFNPRSREGSDQIKKITRDNSYDFNPRSREGSDECDTFSGMEEINFNPRSREGSDPGDKIYLAGSYLFQSTLPRGERRIVADVINARGHQFQSTLPRGERLDNWMDSRVDTYKFQSTLPRGERPVFSSTIVFPSYRFQSTLPRGERRAPERTIEAVYRISIHAPARGATRWRWLWQKGLWNFNPRSREGSDGLGLSELRLLDSFQSTLPRGERRQNCPNILCDFQQFAHFFIHNLLLQANFPSILSIS